MSDVVSCRTSLKFLMALVCCFFDPRSTAAEERSAEQLLPATTAVYVEVDEPGELLNSIWNHPLRSRALEVDGVRAGLASPGYLRFRAILSAVEAELGLTWRNGLEVVTQQGIHLAVDAETEGVIALIGAGDLQKRNEILQKIIQLGREDALRKGREDRYETRAYRGLTAHRVGDLIVAPLGKWLMLSNEGDLAKSTANAFLDGMRDSLSQSDLYQQARRKISGDPLAWGYVDLKRMRERGVAREIFRNQTENVLAEVVFGGIQSDLMRAPLLLAAIYGTPQQVRFQLSLSHNGEVDTAREYYFGPARAGRAPGLLHADRTLLSLSTYRDLSQMWLRAGDLMESGAVDQLAEADSGLTTLFAGKDFGEDILGAFDPGIQLVVRRQEFADRTPQPAVKLPSFALVFRLKDPDAMRPELRRTFQSLVGFVNVAGSSQGQPQLDQDMQTDDDVQLVTTRYVAEEDERESKEARINFNFSPSIGFVADRFVLGSTKELTVELTQLSADDSLKTASDTAFDSTETSLDTETSSGTGVINSQIVARTASLNDLLRDNRDQLVAQNMLEKGHGKTAAEKEIDGLLSFVEFVDGVAIRLSTDREQLRLTLDVNLSVDPSNSAR